MIAQFFSRFKTLAYVLWAWSIWHPEAIPVEEFKYRNLKRVWLPFFDVVGIVLGWVAFAHGSRVLNEVYPPGIIDAAGIIYLIACFVALIGISFPKLWTVEIAGKLVMLTLLGTYGATIWGSFIAGSVESGFIAVMLIYPLIVPLFRLQLLGEEIKQRNSETK